MFAFALALHLASSALPTARACDDGDDATASTGEKKSCPLPDPATTAALPAGGTHVALAVTGMKCGGCANEVHASLMGVDGVLGAQVVLDTGAVNVAYDPKKVSTDKLLAAVASSGEFQAKLAKN